MTLVEPEVACAPLHAPEAVQPEASVDDQVSVLLAPGLTLAGLVASDTVGAGVVAVPLVDPPPHAASASRQADSAKRGVCDRWKQECMVGGPCQWREYAP